MRGIRSLACASTLILLAGCRVGGVPEPEALEHALAADPVLAHAVERTEVPLPFRLGVAPIRATFRPDDLFAKDKASLHGSLPDLDRFRKRVIRGLEATRLFKRVAARGRAESSSHEVGELAWDSRDDLVLELSLESYHQAYLGHSNYLWWFICYVNAVWPAWFVPVDYYGVGLQVEARVRSIQGDAPPLFVGAYVIKPDETLQELTPFDRELASFLDLGALWNVETSLDDSNWQAIERSVGPHARQAFVIRLLRDLESKLAAPMTAGGADAREALLSKVRKRFVLVVGVSSHGDESLGTVPNARNDAQGLSAFFASSAGGGLTPGRDLITLVDAQATRQGILDALATVASRATASDELIVYFAGQGVAVTAGEDVALRLLPEDADSKDLSTALDLAELGALLESTPAARVAVFLDASFAGARSGGRTLGAKDAATPTQSQLDRVLPTGPGRVTLLASRHDQAAGELPGARAGLFSHVLLTGLQGQADEDEDGRVTLQELRAHLEAVVPRQAGLEGFVQQPLILGADDAPALAWPR